MAERHQAYLRIPAIAYSGDNPNNRPALTVGIDHSLMVDH